VPNIGIPELVVLVATVAVPLLIIAGAFVLIVALVRAVRGSGSAATPPRDPATDALRTRFARGEIDEVEFERLRSVLQRR
jgi:uncharacterized membrane protein